MTSHHPSRGQSWPPSRGCRAGIWIACLLAVSGTSAARTRHLKAEERQTHPYGATTLLSYDAVIPAHVVSVDDDANIVSVGCVSDTQLAILVRSPEAALFTWPTGTTLVGGAEWGCAVDQSTKPAPFYRRIAGLPTITPASGAFLLSFPTTLAAFTDCFHRVSVRYTYTPPTTPDPEMSTPQGRRLETTINYQSSSTIKLFSWNYDSNTKSASTAVYPVASVSHLYFKNSFAYADYTFTFALDYQYHAHAKNLFTFSFFSTAALKLQLQPVVSFPSSTSKHNILLYPTDSPSGWKNYARFPIPVGLVPLTLSLDGRFEMDVDLTSQTAVQLSPGGISTSNSWTSGVSYDGTSLKPTPGSDTSFTALPPFYSLPSTGTVVAKVYLRTKFSTSLLSSSSSVFSLPITLSLVPYLTSTFNSSRGACSDTSKIGITSQYGVDFIMSLDPITVFEYTAALGCVSLSSALPGVSRRLQSGSTSSSVCTQDGAGIWSCAYNTSDWGPCSTVCGPGTQSRLVYCTLVATGASAPMSDCAAMDAPPPSTQDCVVEGDSTGLTCSNLSDWAAGQTISANVSSYTPPFPTTYTYKLFAPLQVVSQAGAQQQYAAFSSNEYNVFFHAPDGSKHKLGAPQLFDSMHQPLTIVHDTAYSDDDDGAQACVSVSLFKFRLPQDPAPPTVQAMYLELSVLPCVPLDPSSWVITTNITTTLTSNIIAENDDMSGPTYFVFNPDVNAIGLYLYSFCTYPQELYVSTLPSGTNVNGGVSHFASQYPSIYNFSRFGSKSLFISGSSFIHAPFLITNYPSPGNSSDGLAIVAIDVFGLIPGQPITNTVHSNDRTLYQFVALGDVTTITLTLESFTGDADMFMHTQPFMNSRSNCRCIWSSKSADPVQSLTITNLDLNWATTLYIMVVNSAAALDAGLPSYFRLTGYSYQQLDDGQIVQSTLQPLQYAYFAGAPNSGVPELEQNLAFSANLAVSTLAPATISAFAGSWDLYRPIVQQGFADISVLSVAGGNAVAVQAPYVKNTGVERQMLVSVLSGFSAASNTNDDVSNTPSRRLGEADTPSAYKRLQKRDVNPETPTASQRLEILHIDEESGIVTPDRTLQAITQTLTVHRAGDFAWTVVGQCASGDLACFTLSDVAPGATEYLQLAVAARSSLFLIFQSVLPATSTIPPLFNVQLALGQAAAGSPVFDGTPDDATATSSTLLVVNCGYNNKTGFISATNANVSNIAAGITFGFVSGPVFSDQCQQYQWATSGWFPCSAVCGVGTQTRTSTCEAFNGKAVDPALCDATTTPAETQTCDQGACVWAAGPWNDCDATCGGGAQYRSLACRNQNGLGDVLTAQHCANPPVNAQFCNPEPCPSYYWKPTLWSACSKPCSTGIRRRQVACFDSAADAESADSSLCKATRPATEEVCNTHQCTSSSYQLGVFDLRLLGAGGSKIDDIEERGSRFYQFDNSAASAAGVCIRGDVQPSFTQMCSVSTLTLASQCLSQTRACLVSQFPPPDFNSLTRGAATSKDCGCYTNAQDCLARHVCSDTIRNLTQLVLANCESSNACGATSLCSVQPVVGGVYPADVTLFVRRHNPITSGGSNSFIPPYSNPPVSHAYSDWASSRFIVGSKVMALWQGNGYDQTSEALLIGAVVGGQRVLLDISATPLSGLPLFVDGSGTRTSGVLTFTVTQLRTGGAILNLTLLCDQFQEPSAVLAVLATEAGMPTLYNATVIEGTETVATTLARVQFLGTRGANLLVAGLVASTDTGEYGWNEYVKPTLLLSNDTIVTFQLGMQSAIVTLPPLPLYNPSGSEQLVVSVPDYMLASGSGIALPGVAAVIAATRQDCAVGEWGGWSACSVSCALGTQSRSRPVLAAPANGGMPCIPTVATRKCNSCDPCAGVDCGDNGLCASGACVCQPGWAGPVCTLPAFSLDGTALGVSVSQWSACSASCGPYGTRTRNATCVQLSVGGVSVPLSMDACSAAGLFVNASGPCNAVPCASSSSTIAAATAILSANIPVGTASTQAVVLDAVAATLQHELAALATISPGFIQMNGFSSGPTGTVISFSILSLPGIEVSPLVAGESIQAKLAAGSGVIGTYTPLILPDTLSLTLLDADGNVLATVGSLVAGPSATPGPSGTPDHKSSDSLAPGWIVTIVLACLLAITIVVAVVYIKLRLPRTNKSATYSAGPQSPGATVVVFPKVVPYDDSMAQDAVHGV